MTSPIVPAPTYPRSRFGLVWILLAAGAGIYAGARWHSAIAARLGIPDGGAGAAASETDRKGQLWTCSMHPQVIQDKPGLCPICHMQLTPLEVDVAPPSAKSTPASGAATSAPAPADEIAVAGSQVIIDPTVVQNMGVRTAVVTDAPLEKSIRLFGYFDEAQPNVHDINLRVSGWIRRLHADTEGQHVEVGDPLFDLYSPELQVAVDEMIAARRAVAAASIEAKSTTLPAMQSLLEATISKLELLGLDRRQLDALAKVEKAPDVITFPSPVTGHVTEKPVVEGAAVKAGDRVLRIVDHSTLWLDAQVFEKDLAFVRVGENVSALIASRPGERVTGEIVFIHPHVDMMTRTALVRMAIPNPALDLKPGMYATVRVQSRLKDHAILAPREAILDSGDAQIAFVAQGAGRFDPRSVRLGLSGDGGVVEVLDGLAPGDVVVTSGQFLLDSESRLREAVQKYIREKTETRGRSVAQDRIDAVASSYLVLSAALGEPQAGDSPVDPEPLVSAANALIAANSDADRDSPAAQVATAAEAMRSIGLDAQREKFLPLSTSVIALLEQFPPSTAVGERLYVMHCPMKIGSWLQATEQVANPFYASEMKECGSLERELALTRK